MPKIRSIHPELCESDKLLAISDGAERTLWRLTMHSDDEGRGVDKPKLLSAKLYPLDDAKTDDVIDGHMWELVDAKLLVRYEVDGKRYYEVHDFTDWQKPRHKTPSKLPAPSEGDLLPPPDVRHMSDTCPTPAAEQHHGVGVGGGDGVGGKPSPDGEREPLALVPPEPDEPEHPPVGKPEKFSTRLAQELREQHNVAFDSHDTAHGSYATLLKSAIRCLPPERHHNCAMGVVADYVEFAQGLALTRESRSHTARLMRTHDPTAVLDAYGEALLWGAGIDEEYASDPLSLSKYVAGVLSKRKAAS